MLDASESKLPNCKHSHLPEHVRRCSFTCSERIVGHSYKARIDPAATPATSQLVPKRPSGKLQAKHVSQGWIARSRHLDNALILAPMGRPPARPFGDVLVYSGCFVCAGAVSGFSRAAISCFESRNRRFQCFAQDPALRRLRSGSRPSSRRCLPDRRRQRASSGRRFRSRR